MNTDDFMDIMILILQKYRSVMLVKNNRIARDLVRQQKIKNKKQRGKRYWVTVYTGSVPEDNFCSSRLQVQIILLHQFHNFYQQFNIIMLFSKQLQSYNTKVLHGLVITHISYIMKPNQNSKLPVNGEQIQYQESIRTHYASTTPSYLYTR